MSNACAWVAKGDPCQPRPRLPSPKADDLRQPSSRLDHGRRREKGKKEKEKKI